MSQEQEFRGLEVGKMAVLSHPEKGAEADRRWLERRGLEPGDRFRVKELHVGGWDSSVVFEEIPGIHFNTVHFEGDPS